ncbi:MAG: hypothetical protein HYY03_04940 [Chloroflexi bacterium]|nr:hypothetical protein [Chloroflexota bacterium]
MPRRYRPPVKRRKPKRRTTADILAEPPAPQEIAAPIAVARTAVSTAAPASRSETRHITRDYSYVRTEIVRIALVAGFIVTSLVLTAVFLR